MLTITCIRLHKCKALMKENTQFSENVLLKIENNNYQIRILVEIHSHLPIGNNVTCQSKSLSVVNEYPSISPKGKSNIGITTTP